MCAKDIKEWLAGVVEEEKEGKEGAGDNWRLFLSRITTIWETGEIPNPMLWVIVVLIPKGGGDYHGIGLLEPLWKVLEIIMDCRLDSIEFHDCLCRFLPKRGTGTATTEAKLT